MTATAPRPIVLVPVNRLDRAKGRLADALSPAERESLALLTLRTVLTAARKAQLEAVVLTSDDRAAAAAGERVIREDAALAGLNAQLEAALAKLPPATGGVLVLHADLPLASGEALAALVAAAAPAPSATLVGSRDGGTNAQLLRPPGRYALAYGPGSLARHRAAAEAAGFAVRLVECPALALDLDTPEDIAALLATPAGRASAAGQFLLGTGRFAAR